MLHDYKTTVPNTKVIMSFSRLDEFSLCLSGGGALAMAHTGVVRALMNADCFPKVISGTSGGAILAGYLATLTDGELKDNLDLVFNYDLANKFGVRFLPTLWEQLFGAYRTRILMDTDYFVHSVKKYVGNLTFREAWLKTGRHVSITVSYSTKNNNTRIRVRDKNKTFRNCDYCFEHKHQINILNCNVSKSTLAKYYVICFTLFPSHKSLKCNNLKS